MNQSDIEKLLEDMEVVVRDLQDNAPDRDDNYDDAIDLITTLSEQLSIIYLTE